MLLGAGGPMVATTTPVWSGASGLDGHQVGSLTAGDMILTSRRGWTAVRQLVPATGSVGWCELPVPSAGSPPRYLLAAAGRTRSSG